jgi:hypothetical protein
MLVIFISESVHRPPKPIEVGGVVMWVQIITCGHRLVKAVLVALARVDLIHFAAPQWWMRHEISITPTIVVREDTYIIHPSVRTP